MLKITTIRKDNWVINENNSNYQLSELDYKTYSKVWRETVNSCLCSLVPRNYKVLIINDASQLIYNSLSIPSKTTLVDPLAYMYTETPYKELLNTVSYKNYMDSFGNVRTLSLIDETFDQAYTDCLSKNKYDLLFINIKSVEDLTYKTVEQFFTLLSDYGCLFMQIPLDIQLEKETVLTLNHYFSFLSSRTRGSIVGSSQSFTVYRKIQGLI